MLCAVSAAPFVSLQLARFDHLRTAGPADPVDRAGVLFCEVGADCRAAGTDPASRGVTTVPSHGGRALQIA